MWEYIFDYQQREIVKDQLTNDDLCLLFYFSKSIINEEFLASTEPTLFKGFTYKKILEDVKTLYIKQRQLKNLIIKLNNAGYIIKRDLFASVKIALNFKMFKCLSAKQIRDSANIKYLALLKWKKISKLAIQHGKKFPSFTKYYNNIITKNNFNNINIYNYINTRDIKYISSNIGDTKEPSFNSLALLFEKYPKYETDEEIMLPPNFNCERLVNAIDKSDYLKKVNLYFLIHNYKEIIAGKYEKWEDAPTDKKTTSKNKVRDYSKGKDLLDSIG